MFITPNTIFSQLFWLIVSFCMIYFVIVKVFIKKIGANYHKRFAKFALLEHEIEQLHEKSVDIDNKIRQKEKDMYDQMQLQMKELYNKTDIELQQNLNDLKEYMSMRKMTLETDLKNWQTETKNDFNNKIEQITTNIVEKIVRKQ